MGVFKEKKIFDENPVFKKEPCTLWYTYNNDFEFLCFQVFRKNSNSIRQYSFCARLQNINCQHSTCVTVATQRENIPNKAGLAEKAPNSNKLMDFFSYLDNYWIFGRICQSC